MRNSAAEKLDDKEYQTNYYRTNRPALLEKKKARYAKDPSYRDAAKSRAKRQYWFVVRPTKHTDFPHVELASIENAGIVPVRIDNPKDVRDGALVPVRVYTTSAVGQLLNRSGQTIRIWEREGVIPPPAYRGRDFEMFVSKGRNPRLYTEDEMRVLEKAQEFLDLPSESMKDSLFARFVAEHFAELHQGLFVREL